MVSGFELLLEHARIVLDASDTLAECLKNGNQVGETARRVRDLEHSGHEALRKICCILRRSFITPIDPEDIHYIGSLSEEILDHLEAVAYRIEAYDMERSRQQISEVSGMAHECVQATYSALETLQREGVRKPDELTRKCEEVSRRESAAEERLRAATRELFVNEHDPIQLMKQKEICGLLKATGDCCEDMADVLEAVAVKNS
jgi:uncharacterized protein Yka (UPF0111/DUF47 family)